MSGFTSAANEAAKLRTIQEEKSTLRDAVASAEESLHIFINRYQGGVDDYLQVITAQTTALTNQRYEIDIQRRRSDASVLLIKALGGGWDVSNLPSIQSLRKG